MTSTHSLWQFLRREPELSISFVCALVSAFFVPPSAAYLDYIDLRVLCLLFCLMAVVAGVQECGLFLVLAVLLGLLVRCLTRNETAAYGTALVLIAALTVAYFVNQSWFEGLLPAIMKKLSLFEQFQSFVNGVFDLTAVVYYLSVTVFFLLLAVQSLEKRRYN